MNKILLSLFCISFLAFAGAQPSPKVYQYTETMQMDLPSIDEKNWKCAYKAASPHGQSIVEWIRKDQSLKNWQEMITIQFFAAKCKEEGQRTAIETMQSLHMQMKKKYPSLKWNVIEKSKNDVIFEWSLPKGHESIEPQHELVRLVCSKSGLHRMAYTKKVAELTREDRSTWVDFLKNAKIKKNR